MRRIASLVFLASSLVATSARAADAPNDREKGEDGRRIVAVTINPLPLVAGRYGANLDVLPVPHHAVTTSLFVQTFPLGLLRRYIPEGFAVADPPARLGGEVGYRFYGGKTAANGLFAGPSLVLMPIAYPRATDAGIEVTSFHAYGGALDVGVQAVTPGGFTIGGGLGVMALAYALPRSNVAGIEIPPIATPRVLPRLLFAAGWSF
jgi:hypothetical protein